MYQLIFIGLLVAGLSFAGFAVWTGFTGSYEHKGALAQLALDTPKLKASETRATDAEARADHAEADAAAVKAASATQSAAIAEANLRADQAAKAARTQAIAYATEVAKNVSRINQLQAAAAATPKQGQSCVELLNATDAILRESGRIRSKP